MSGTGAWAGPGAGWRAAAARGLRGGSGMGPEIGTPGSIASCVGTAAPGGALNVSIGGASASDCIIGSGGGGIESSGADAAKLCDESGAAPWADCEAVSGTEARPSVAAAGASGGAPASVIGPGMEIVGGTMKARRNHRTEATTASTDKMTTKPAKNRRTRPGLVGATPSHRMAASTLTSMATFKRHNGGYDFILA